MSAKCMLCFNKFISRWVVYSDAKCQVIEVNGFIRFKEENLQPQRGMAGMRNCSHNCELLESEQTPDQQKLVWHQENLFLEGLLHSYSSHKLYKRLILPLLVLLLLFIYIAEVPRGPTQDHVPDVFWTAWTRRYCLPWRQLQVIIRSDKWRDKRKIRNPKQLYMRFVHIIHLKTCPHSLFYFMETDLGKIYNGEEGSFLLTEGRVFLHFRSSTGVMHRKAKNCLEHNCRAMRTV